jgi:spore coat protein H
VTVNGVDLGPYVHVESMKRPFLRLHFGDPDGHFYEGQVSDFRPDLDWSFQRKHDDMPEDNPDVAAATMALGNTDTGWYEDVEALFDIDAYLTFWAVEVLVGHWDSYNGNRNNYYVYNDPSQDRFVFLPWGPDSVFQLLENPFDEISYPPSMSAHGMLGHRLWERPESQQAYVKRLLDVLDTAWDEAHLHAEVERMSELIMPLMSSSRRYQALADLDRIHAFIDRQRPAILEDVADGPVEWNHELPSVTCW